MVGFDPKFGRRLGPEGHFHNTSHTDMAYLAGVVLKPTRCLPIIVATVSDGAEAHKTHRDVNSGFPRKAYDVLRTVRCIGGLTPSGCAAVEHACIAGDTLSGVRQPKAPPAQIRVVAHIPEMCTLYSTSLVPFSPRAVEQVRTHFGSDTACS